LLAQRLIVSILIGLASLSASAFQDDEPEDPETITVYLRYGIHLKPRNRFSPQWMWNLTRPGYPPRAGNTARLAREQQVYSDPFVRDHLLLGRLEPGLEVTLERVLPYRRIPGPFGSYRGHAVWVEIRVPRQLVLEIVPEDSGEESPDEG